MKQFFDSIGAKLIIKRPAYYDYHRVEFIGGWFTNRRFLHPFYISVKNNVFKITKEDEVDLIVLDKDEDSILLLAMLKGLNNHGDWNGTYDVHRRFLCGVDGRRYFAHELKIGNTTLEAKLSMIPREVRKRLPEIRRKNWLKNNHLYKRQGNLFFVEETFLVDRPVVHHNYWYPEMRYGHHVIECLTKIRSETRRNVVWMYAKGKVRRKGYKTIELKTWHRMYVGE